jgi:hypothetical protein
MGAYGEGGSFYYSDDYLYSLIDQSEKKQSTSNQKLTDCGNKGVK